MQLFSLPWQMASVLMPLTSDRLCEQKWLRSVLTSMTGSIRPMVSVGSSRHHRGRSSLTPQGGRQETNESQAWFSKVPASPLESPGLKPAYLYLSG